jgi:hypothetical protein
MAATSVRTAENQKEFAVAAMCSTLFRHALSLIFRNADNKVIGELLSFFLDIIKQDNVNPRGERIFLKAKAALMKNASFFSGTLHTLFSIGFDAKITETTGKVKGTITFAKNVSPKIDIDSMTGATHLQVTLFICGINFRDGHSTPIVKSVTQLFDLSKDTSTIAKLETAEIEGLTADHTRILVIHTTYAQMVNNVAYPLNSRSKQTLTILDAI